MQHILVTGSDGFIGRELTNLLRRDGRTVTELGIDLDIRDRESVSHVVAGAKPDAIVHLAAVSGPMLLRDDPAQVTAVNAVGTVNVFEAARLVGVKRVIYASSIAVIEVNATRGSPPLSMYGVTKQFGETVASLYRDMHGVDSTSARIGSVYGTGRRTEHVLSSMIAEAHHSGLIHYDSMAAEALISVQDAARLLAALLDVHPLRNTYDLVTDVKTHRELAFLVAELTNSVAIPTEVSGPPVITWAQQPDLRRVLTETGREVAVPIREGIADLIASYRSTGVAGPPGRIFP